MARFDWLQELPLTPGEPDLRMGLRALPDDQWLLSDQLTAHELTLRKQVLANQDHVVCRQPGHAEAEEELLDHVLAFLGQTKTDRAEHGEPTDPLQQVAVLVPEDLCLMAKVDQTWRLVAGTLLFANNWSLAEKLGGTLLDVHEPIEGYADVLKDRVNTFFNNMTVGRMAWRRNWFLHDSDEYYQPEAFVPRAFQDPNEAQHLFVRSERETLRRLPKSDAIVFSIKTQIAPLWAVRQEQPQVAHDMAQYLVEASPRALRGKDAQGRSEAVVQYFRQASN